uniref:Uncharacterized protein n=1 Tax=Caenorhabditis japonica TaxID=281687 RepID=A0A8R1ETB2_CAEJA
MEAYNGWKAWSKLALDTVQRLREIPLGLPDLVARLTLPAEEEEAIDQLVNHCESKQLEPKLVALRAVHLRVLDKISHARPFFELDEGELDDATPTENGSSVQTTVPTHPIEMDSHRTFNKLAAPTPPTQSTQADPRNREVADVEEVFPVRPSLQPNRAEEHLGTMGQPESIKSLEAMRNRAQERTTNASNDLGEALAVAEDLGDQLQDPARVLVLQDLRGRVTQARADWNTEVREANNSRENERLREEVDRLRMLLITNEERGQPTQRVTPRSVQDESPGTRNNSWDEPRNQMYQVNPTEAARMIPQFDGTREGYSNFIRIYDALVGSNAPAHWKFFVLSTKLTKCTHALSKLENPALAYEETRRRLKELFGSTENSLKLSAELQRASVDRHNPEQMRTDLARIASIIDRMEQSEYGASRG